MIDRYALIADIALVSTPLSAEDYVTGLNILGFNFTLWTPFEGAPDGVLRGRPTEILPAGWNRQALRIMSAFGTGRCDEVVTFLRKREGIEA